VCNTVFFILRHLCGVPFGECPWFCFQLKNRYKSVCYVVCLGIKHHSVIVQ
jgi:hypothetical protein